jgi:hypothetical protein
MTDRFAAARQIADAVLYEGYVLYPYRASATKNQMRWQFGVLTPRSYAERDGSERWRLRTECVVDPGAAPVLNVRVRFLQAQRRAAEGEQPWDEAVEQEIDVDGVKLLPLAEAARTTPFHIAGGAEDDDGVVRKRQPLDGQINVEASWADGPGALLKVAVTVENRTDSFEPTLPREAAMHRSLLGVHTLLAVDDGELVSVLDPPEHAAEAVRGCASDGTFPVLVGRVVLSSPIILYDNPVIAPESGGDLFDATEIDEILGLRVLTLTDAEKDEARRTDPRAAAIIDRIEAMDPAGWAALHGTIRSIESMTAPAEDETLPWWEPAIDEGFDPFTDTLVIAGKTVAAGTPVRLHPNRRSDAHDMFLRDMAATVTGVFTDVDQSVLVAVTVDDDPASEALAWQGRALFFHPDEIEVLA